MSETIDPQRDRKTTRHGWTFLVSLIGFGLAITAMVDGMGLKYVQGIIWPTDLHAFGLWDRPVALDVAILGSSRASFDFTPSAIDSCLTSSLQRDTQTVNLARVYATTHTMRTLYRDLLEDSPPKVLVIAMAPEAVDESNPMLGPSIAASIGATDVPREVAASRSLSHVTAALRPIARGAETLPFLLAGRHREEERLHWIMTRHGGGQWCSGTSECTNQNFALEQIMERRWDQATRNVLPNMAETHFSTYEVGTGRVHDAFVELLEVTRAQGVKVVLVDLPMHRLFSEVVPPYVRSAYNAHVQGIADAHQLTFYRPNADKWVDSRRAWVDPDHLGHVASIELSRTLCREVLLPLLQEEKTEGGR